MPNSDGVPGENLLGRNIECSSSEVDLPKGINARNNKPETGALGASFLNPAKSEDDGSLVFINSLERTDVSRDRGPRLYLP